MDEIFNYNFNDDENRKRSYCGVFLKNNDNFKNYVPDSFSNIAFAHQGYTGSMVAFDIKNKKSIIIFVDAIENNSLFKSSNYFTYFHKLKLELTNYLEEM